MKPRKARLKDIAALSGVSIGTVDRVLHERGEVAKKTKLRVLEISRNLNYTPNVMARVLKTKRPFNIISLLPGSTAENTFWKKHPQGIEKAMSELEYFPITLTQINFDILNEADFVEKTRSIVKLHPDGVVLAPIFKTESIEFCHKLIKNHIPFVFVDGYLNDTDFLAYIGENVYQSGRVAGQLIDMITPRNKDILIVNIAKNLQNVHHLDNRTKGFLSYFPQSGKNKGEIIKLNIPDTKPETIKNSIERVFKKNPYIFSIFITGSKSYKIASYIESAGMKSNIIGYDLLDSNIKYLKSGIIRFLIGQRPEEQTYKAIKKLFDYLSFNKIPEKMEYLPIDVITSENVDLYT